MTVIGVTGGVGSGKSTVLSVLEGYGAVLCSTDEIGRDVMEPGGLCYEEILRVFGEGILAENKTIDRRHLADVVFNRPGELSKLEAIVHPAVKTRVKEALLQAREKGEAYFVIESALLFEDHYECLCDTVWTVHTKKKVRIARLRKSRGYSRAKCLRVMAAQKSADDYIRRSDAVIYNSFGEDRTKRQIDRLMRTLGKRSGRSRV